MKRISFGFYLAIIASLFLASCVKDRNEGPDFSSTKPVLELRTPINDIAGLAYFGRAVIGNLPDTVQFYANLASANTFDKAINVTIGVDPSRLDEYNGDDANALKYELLPDSTYSILKTTGTIVAGQRIDSFQVAFFKDKIDPTRNYMLPIAITDGENVLISHNMGLIWFHAIGNPLAGNYLQSWYRYNDLPDTTGPPNSTVSENVLVSVAPEDPTTIFLPEGYLTVNGLGGVSLGFTNNAGVVSDPFVFLNETTTDNLAGVGFSVLTQPKLVSYQIKGDANNHYAGTTFRIYFEVLNSSGGNRKTINEFVKQ